MNRTPVFYKYNFKIRTEKNALCDYFVDAMYYDCGERIQCTVGLRKDNGYYFPEYIFIKDQYTENGTHVCADTIQIEGSCFQADILEGA